MSLAPSSGAEYVTGTQLGPAELNMSLAPSSRTQLGGAYAAAARSALALPGTMPLGTLENSGTPSRPSRWAC
jgi:hypothetical protein